MLEIKDLVVSYDTGRNAFNVVDRVSLTVPRGSTLGLVGESGCGKSSLARAIVGLIPISGGRILIDGIDHTERRSRDTPAFRRRVQMIFQDPYSSLNPRMTVAQMIGEALSMQGSVMSSKVARRVEALRILDLVGLSTKVLHRYPHSFSGGQRQRIAIARALAVGPELIITDEITSALDVSIQATILNLLKDLQREHGLAFLFITHDLSVVRYMSDQVAVMYLGEVVELASTEDLFIRPQHPYLQALINSIPQLASTRSKGLVSGDQPDPRTPPLGCRFNPRCPAGPRTHPERTICLAQDPQRIADSRLHRTACHFAAEVRASP